ncbi:hypothetical protein Tco_1113660 [Tanacetum coccineum]|uniref:Uncharacterized protein n=1 Tax=Tanacetum coccineum TaxID=301880 RepID=A0ABQ5ISW7_9ASTR
MRSSGAKYRYLLRLHIMKTIRRIHKGRYGVSVLLTQRSQKNEDRIHRIQRTHTPIQDMESIEYSDQGRSREVPKLRIEAKKQEKRSLEVVTSTTGFVILNREVSTLPNHPTSDNEGCFFSNFQNYIPLLRTYVPASQEKLIISSSNNSFGVVSIVSPTLSLFHDDPYMKVMHAYYAKESPIPPPTIVPPSTMLSPIMPPKRMSTFEAPAMTQAAIRKLVADSVTTALEAQAANMTNTDNTTRPREAPVARQCSYKEFMSC